MLQKLNKNNYLKVMLVIALPITLQILLQNSLSIIDQVMVGKLGEVSIAAIGFANKVSAVYFFTAGAITGTAGILISQYYGKQEECNISKSLKTCFTILFIFALIFFTLSFCFSEFIIGLYTKDQEVIKIGKDYLRIISFGFLINTFSSMIATLYRSTGQVIYTTIVGVMTVFVNTFFNYILIFGNFGFKEYGVYGAGIATTITRFIEFLLLLIYFIISQKRSKLHIDLKIKIEKTFFKNTFVIALPLIVAELCWSVGESVYGSIYGHIGTIQSSAMTLIGPIISLSVGLFSGVSQATSTMVGNRLGAKDLDTGYFIGRRFIQIGIIGTVIIGSIIIGLSGVYVKIYEVMDVTKDIARRLLISFGLVLWIKVSNMIIGGILKSGGKTKYVLMQEIIGTWCVGVPLGYIAAFALKLDIEWVYLIIAFEEFVRFLIGLGIIRSKKWMQTVK